MRRRQELTDPVSVRCERDRSTAAVVQCLPACQLSGEVLVKRLSRLRLNPRGVPTAIEQDEAKLPQHPLQGFAHARRRMGVIVSMQRHDGAANIRPKREEFTASPQLRRLRPHSLVDREAAANVASLIRNQMVSVDAIKYRAKLGEQ